MKRMARNRQIVALLTAVALFLTACGSSATAAAMSLAKAEGTVGIADGDGKSVPVSEDRSLYSGYQVGTEAKSHAWISLDDVKLVKMDEESAIELRKENRNLEIFVNSGQLFFNITEPLEEDETLEIRTSTMTVGIRGTCGWVSVLEEGHMQVCILEGTVHCGVTDPASGQSAEADVSAGEKADIYIYPEGEEAACEIVKSRLSKSDIPDFVLEEVSLEELGTELAEEPEEETDGETAEGADEEPAEMLQGDFDKHGLICNVELDKEYPYTTLTYRNKDISVNGTVLFSNYRTFESDEEHEGIEGYEWKSVDVTFTYDDDNAWDYGTTSSPFAIDFYNIEPKGEAGANKNESDVGILVDNDTYTVNFNGIDYTECLQEDHALVMEWNDRVYTCKIQFSFRVPIGYDGSIVGAISDGQYSEGDYIYEVADENTLFFRLK